MVALWNVGPSVQILSVTMKSIAEDSNGGSRSKVAVAPVHVSVNVFAHVVIVAAPTPLGFCPSKHTEERKVSCTLWMMKIW